MATCVDVAGASYPAEATPLEGRSLVAAFENKPMERDAIYWEHEGNRAIRVGEWKAVAKGPAGPKASMGAWELYDLTHDRTEQHDLAGAQPERLRKLVRMWDEYAARTHVLPSIVPAANNQ